MSDGGVVLAMLTVYEWWQQRENEMGNRGRKNVCAVVRKGWLNDNSSSIHWTDTCIVSSKQYELHLQFVPTRPTLFFSLNFFLLCVVVVEKGVRTATIYNRNTSPKKYFSSTSNYSQITFYIFSLKLFCIAFQVPSAFGNQIEIKNKNYPFAVCSNQDETRNLRCVYVCDSISP